MAEVVRGCLRLPQPLPRKPPHHLVKCKDHTTQTDHSPALCQTAQQKQSGHANLPQRAVPSGGQVRSQHLELGSQFTTQPPVPQPSQRYLCSSRFFTQKLSHVPSLLSGKPWPLPCPTGVLNNRYHHHCLKLAFSS